MEMAHAQAAADPDFRHPWEDKFESLDDNGNGVLDGDELLELAGWTWSSLRPPTTAPPSDAVKLVELKKIMEAVDKNHDGELSRDEFAEYYTDLLQSIMVMEHAQAVADPDFRHQWEDKFESLDDNGNGVLDGDELLELAGWTWSSLRPPTTAPPSDAVKLVELKKIMEAVDKNHDGELSRDEFAEYYTDLLQSIELARRGW